MKTETEIKENAYLNIEWFDFDGIFTGLGIASTTLNPLFVEDIPFITEEVHMTSNHTDSKVLAVVMVATNSEELFQALEVLGNRWGAGDGNQH